MKYWFGYLVAGILAGFTWVLQQFGSRYSTLVDMVYPYVVRTMEDFLAGWSGEGEFMRWQLIELGLGVIVLASLVVVVATRRSLIGWGGWMLSIAAAVYMLHTLMWGLNYYAGPLSDDLRLEVAQYTLSELKEATEYYRDKANILSEQVKRDGSGVAQLADFDTLAERAGEGFEVLTLEHSYPVFAGCKLPVKKLGWADMYSSMGITGVTFGITGEAAVNPQIPDVALPFTMCHEMAHRMCIANERDANFAAFLACSVHPDVEFEYSAYFMAYRYCFNALSTIRTQDGVLAAKEIKEGVGQKLQTDLNNYSSFFSQKRNDAAASFADTANDTYLRSSGDSAGIGSYSQVCDLLVNWHIQQVVLPSISTEEFVFDPFDRNQVDVSDIIH